MLRRRLGAAAATVIVLVLVGVGGADASADDQDTSWAVEPAPAGPTSPLGNNTFW